MSLTIKPSSSAARRGLEDQSAGEKRAFQNVKDAIDNLREPYTSTTIMIPTASRRDLGKVGEEILLALWGRNGNPQNS